jgi:hypothetical protein
MPYTGVAWEGEQHSKLTWYPGNPVATQQVLGPRETNDPDKIVTAMMQDLTRQAEMRISSGFSGAFTR